MTEDDDKARSAQRTDGSADPFRRLMHDIRQPLNAIRFIAQDLRLDAKKNRLDVETIPERMREIESAVDELVSRLDLLRDVLKSKKQNRG